MNYIVFDLEWNQCPYGKSAVSNKIPFEIIEIGAVKLDDNKQKIDKFQVYVKPKVYKKMHFHAGKVTGLSIEDLDCGLPFKEAADKFLEWCGEDYSFCSWGEQDLTEFQRNLKYYGMLDRLKGPMLYENIQLQYAMYKDEPDLMRSLEYAASDMNIQIEGDFHRALDDAECAAMVFAVLPDELTDKYPSLNTYQNPKKRADEIYVEFDGYLQYVSREFKTKEAAMTDIVVRDLYCNFCNRNLNPLIKWYAKNNKNYYALGKCPAHGFIKGKIHMMKTDDDKFYVIKTIGAETQENALEQLEEKAYMFDKPVELTI